MSTLLIFGLSFIVLGCSKSDNPQVDKEFQEYKINTSSFSGITNKEVTLNGEIQLMGTESLLDHGFIIQHYDKNGQTTAEETISLGKTEKSGVYSAKYKPSKSFEQNIPYTYFFYVRTDKNFYKGNRFEFSLNNLNLSVLPDRYSYGHDTLKIEGNFEGLQDKYKIQVKGAFEIFSVPFAVSSDKKSISFMLTAGKDIMNSEMVQVNLVRKDENPYHYEQQLVKITYLSKVNLKISDQGKLYYLDFYVENLADSYYSIPNLYILIDGKKIPYNKSINLYDYEEFSGPSFKIGYMNGRDSVYFLDPYVLDQPSKDLDLTPSVPKIHPYSWFSYVSPDLDIFFWSYMSANIGDQEIRAYYYYRTHTAEIYVGEIEEGEYDLKLYNRFYSYIPPKKVIVEKLKVKSTGPFSAYIGDTIILKGNFINGYDYLLLDSENYTIGSARGKEGTLAVELNPNFDTLKKFSVGLVSSTTVENIPIGGEISFNSLGISLDKFYPQKGTSGDILTIEGHGMGLIEEFLLGDATIKPVKINNNKTTIPLPFIRGKGKMKIGYTVNNKYYQTNDYFEYY